MLGAAQAAKEGAAGAAQAASETAAGAAQAASDKAAGAVETVRQVAAQLQEKAGVVVQARGAAAPVLGSTACMHEVPGPAACCFNRCPAPRLVLAPPASCPASPSSLLSLFPPKQAQAVKERVGLAPEEGVAEGAARKTGAPPAAALPQPSFCPCP